MLHLIEESMSTIDSQDRSILHVNWSEESVFANGTLIIKNVFDCFNGNLRWNLFGRNSEGAVLSNSRLGEAFL